MRMLLLQFIIYFVPSLPILQYLNNIEMTDKKSANKLYNSRNIQIRRNIRELDMNITNSLGPRKPSDINVLVVGPNGAGKACLFKTIFYALNASLSYTIEVKQAQGALIERYEIKKNKKYSVEGLTCVKQTDQKLGISAYVLKSHNQMKNPMEKYSRAAEMIGGKTLGCIGPLGYSPAINYVVVCLNMVEKISKEQLIGVKYFLSELEDKGIKFTIVGTHLDAILGTGTMKHDLSLEMEQQKIIYMENWKHFIIEEVRGKEKPEIYCMENYDQFKKQKFQNSELINFYALNLLDQIIKQVQRSQREKLQQKKTSSCGGNKFLWFCS